MADDYVYDDDTEPVLLITLGPDPTGRLGEAASVELVFEGEVAAAVGQLSDPVSTPAGVTRQVSWRYDGRLDPGQRLIWPRVRFPPAGQWTAKPVILNVYASAGSVA